MKIQHLLIRANEKKDPHFPRKMPDKHSPGLRVLPEILKPSPRTKTKGCHTDENIHIAYSGWPNGAPRFLRP